MLNLNKSAQVVLNLTKDQGIEGQKAKVIFAADYSGSMDTLYANGTVQRIMERLVPIAMTFDPSKELGVYLFDHGYHKVPMPVTENNVSGFIGAATRGRTMGGTNYAPIINAIAQEGNYTYQTVRSTKMIEKPAKGFWGKLLGATVAEEVDDFRQVQVPVDKKGIADLPTLVIFITDGENSDRSAAMQAIAAASHQPIFFQFVGIGGANFRFLKELDEMEGRYIDNANFFEITTRDLTQATDEDLYQRILNEFGRQYIPLAKSPQYRLIA